MFNCIPGFVDAFDSLKACGTLSPITSTHSDGKKPT